MVLRLLLATITALLILTFQFTPVTAQKSPDLGSQELIKIAKQEYDLGQLQDSAIALQKAANLAQSHELLAVEIKAQSLLSLVYEQLGQWQKAQQAIDRSFSLLAKIPELDLAQTIRLRAGLYNRQGRWQLATGRVEASLATAKQAEELYRQVSDLAGVTGSKINQIEALEVLGFYRQARQIQRQLEQNIVSLPDTEIKLLGLYSIGNLKRQEGEFASSQKSLERALSLTERLDLPEQKSKILLSLANTESLLAQNNKLESSKYLQQAVEHYHKAIDTATSSLTKTQARLNELSLSLTLNKASDLQNLVSTIDRDLESLPTGRSAIFARLNLAQSLLPVSDNLSKQQANKHIVANLNKAIALARQLKDTKAESYAKGILGKWYERQENWNLAEKSTKSALSIAQTLNLPELTYQWQWQMGRITRVKPQAENRVKAIAYYDLALESLQSLRRDLTVLNPELQFSFQESVEPVYRQYIELLLNSPQQDNDNLIKSVRALEALQVAKLNNLFKDACAQAQTIDVGSLDESTAIIYPIVLSDSLELILKLPGEDKLYHHTQANVSESDIDLAVEKLQRSLIRRSTSPSQLKKEATGFYNWLIEPFARELETNLERDRSKIKNLVFILDGTLRNLPMSVLSNGQNYLIERYGIAIAPGIELVKPEVISGNDLEVLLAGAVDSPSFKERGFAPLENVATELLEIARVVPESKKLEGREFRRTKIQEQINDGSFNVVHIATHGKFSSNSESTYILDWDRSIGLKDLDRLLETEDLTKIKPIELLVLSACETAVGDRQAALGLAGVAVRSGASSTIASLWQVDDASTAQFMVRLYQELSEPQLTKAEALRNAQLHFLQNTDNSDYNRPYHWASFILVGDWR